MYLMFPVAVQEKNQHQSEDATKRKSPRIKEGKPGGFGHVRLLGRSDAWNICLQVK